MAVVPKGRRSRSVPQTDPRPYVRLLERRLPGLAIRRVRASDTGWACFVLEVNGAWIFRFPRTFEVSRKLETEIRLLGELEQQLPIPVPHYEWVVRNSKGRIQFAGYPKLYGRPLPSRNLGGPEARRWISDLTATLQVLLRFPRARAQRIGVTWSHRPTGVERWRWLYPRICRRVHPLLPAEVRYRDRTYWEQYLHDPARKQVLPVLNHGDLFPEHILVSDRGVSGILDWEDACYEDPVGNLAGLPTADRFADQVARGYLGGADPGFGARLAFHRHATWAYPMVFGLENRDTQRDREAYAHYKRTFPA